MNYLTYFYFFSLECGYYTILNDLNGYILFFIPQVVVVYKDQSLQTAVESTWSLKFTVIAMPGNCNLTVLGKPPGWLGKQRLDRAPPCLRS